MSSLSLSKTNTRSATGELSEHPSQAAFSVNCVCIFVFVHSSLLCDAANVIFWLNLILLFAVSADVLSLVTLVFYSLRRELSLLHDVDAGVGAAWAWLVTPVVRAALPAPAI